MLLLLLLACRHDKAADPPGNPGPSDSDAPGEAGGQDSAPGDTDETGDSGDTADPIAPWGIESRPANETCFAVERPPNEASVQFTRVFSSLSLPLLVALVHRPGDDSEWYAALQGGKIVRFDNDPATTTSATALDLTSKVSAWSGNEDGLLGLAFHPDFPSEPYLYVNYTSGPGSARLSNVARFTSPDGGQTFDPDSEEILLSLEQPYSNHNGGHVLFGPDGYLYLGFGDGGGGGDPEGNAQDTGVLLGKMLRIDVDGGDPYAIPADNPFADGVGGKPEIYAYGLRNPWRYAFDRETGELWVGDVGQNDWEEIHTVENGGNYGWNLREGFACYPETVEECPGPYIDPVYAYSHWVGDSVTGGYVYRGAAIPDLVGHYLYADAYQAWVHALFFDEAGEPAPLDLGTVSGYPSSFAEDLAGELYVTTYDNGRIYKIEPAGEPQPSTFPALLSETGCVDPDDPTQPAPGMIPYAVNSPLWSDGAEKQRWLAIPDGTTIAVREDGTFELPIGSVVLKQFAIGGRPVETRLLMLHDDGSWAGYSYAWDELGADAELLPADRVAEVEGQTWAFPSRSQCLSCHTEAAGRVLGLRAQQLDGLYDYGDARANQLDTFEHIGLLPAGSPRPGAYPAPDDASAAVDARSRAYLDTNCSMCHQPNSTGGGELDLRYSAPFADTGACGAAPINGDLGVSGAQILAPGDPDRSVLSLRMRALDAHRMPPLGSTVVDDEGVGLIDEWIGGLEECP